jgi:ABC-type multidrug transport system fused ATPase/permease subunit
VSGDPKPSPGEFRRAARVLKPFVREQRRPFLLALAMLTFEAVTAVAEPVPIAYLIDFLRGDVDPLGSLTGRASTVAVLTVAIVVIAMVNALGDSLAEIFLARGGRMLGYRIRVSLYSNLQKLSLGFHNQRRTGDVLLRVTSDVEALEKFVTTSVGDLAGSMLVLTGTLAFLVFRSWQVALVAVLIVPLLSLVSNWFSTRIRSAAKTQRSREADLASAAQEMLTSIGVVQAYGRADYELERFSEHSAATRTAALRAASLEARFSWTVKVFEALATVAIVWLGLWLVDRTAITVGTLVLFVLLIQNMFKPTRKIIKEWSTIGKLLASLERIGDLLDRRPAVDDLPGARPAPAFAGRVELDHVTFGYGAESDGHREPGPDRPVALDDVSLRVAPGEVLALVGHSGAGKSTIASLIPRLYDPTGGRVMVDGEDVRGYTLDSLRAQVSMVLQETLLFSGTVADNIAYGRSDATREEIEAAARSANAHEFIEAMPDGYDTVLNERASNLSGGQRQRLAIARAFIRDTPILILDEPTTGLDAESTGLVLTALRTLMRGKATIIISHDLNLVRWAGRVLVLRAGRVVQDGTHAELLARPGEYAELFASAAGLREPGSDSSLVDLTTSGNGNGHRVRDLPAGGSELDLLDNPRVLAQLPGLAAAFDPGAMAERFQGALFPDSPWLVERCRPGKATYLPGDRCLVRYELDVRHRETGATLHPLLLGRLFSDGAACRRYAGERLAPLVAAVAGRPEVDALASPVVTFDRLAMAVSAFPLDGDLPTLVAATDERRMLEVLRRMLPEASGRAVALRSCEIHLGHYGRQHRCVLRYVVGGTSGPTGERYQRVVYGKVLDASCARVAGEALSALGRASASGAVDLRTPAWLGYDAELRLALLSALPGAALVSPLLRARLAEEPSAVAAAAPVTLEGAVARCAEVAAALHRSGLAVGPLRQLRDELAWLDGELAAVASVAPSLASRLGENRSELEEAAADCDALPFVPSHGDFTPGQVLFDGARPGLLDFDTVCRAEPGLDLGQFIAYLRLAVAKQVGPGGAPELEAALVDRFLGRYATAAGLSPRADRSLRTRVSVYEQISLLRLALHSFAKLKPQRLELVLQLLGQDVDVAAR